MRPEFGAKYNQPSRSSSSLMWAQHLALNLTVMLSPRALGIPLVERAHLAGTEMEAPRGGRASLRLPPLAALGRFWSPKVQQLLLPTGSFYPKLSVTLHVLCRTNLGFRPMVMVTHGDVGWSRGSEF